MLSDRAMLGDTMVSTPILHKMCVINYFEYQYARCDFKLIDDSFNTFYFQKKNHS